LSFKARRFVPLLENMVKDLSNFRISRVCNCWLLPILFACAVCDVAAQQTVLKGQAAHDDGGSFVTNGAVHHRGSDTHSVRVSAAKAVEVGVGMRLDRLDGGSKLRLVLTHYESIKYVVVSSDHFPSQSWTMAVEIDPLVEPSAIIACGDKPSAFFKVMTLQEYLSLSRSIDGGKAADGAVSSKMESKAGDFQSLGYRGKEWFVSKRFGSDDYDGLSKHPDRTRGPFRSISKALECSSDLDRVVILDGEYHESLVMSHLGRKSVTLVPEGRVVLH
jgi:hypothetical protein